MVRRTFISGKGILLPVSKEAIQAYEWMDKMSDNSNRDTQFQGFAKLLLQEMLETDLGYTRTVHWREGMEKIIVRWAYNLVYHAQADPKDLDVLGFEEAIQRIPDMTELPKEQDEPS